MMTGVGGGTHVLAFHDSFQSTELCDSSKRYPTLSAATKATGDVSKSAKQKKLIFNWVGGVVWCKTHKLHLLYGTDGMLRLLLESPMSKAYESEYVNILPATLDNNDSSLH